MQEGEGVLYYLDDDVEAFKAYLLTRMSKSSVSDRMAYYYLSYVLDTGDATPVLQLTPHKKLHCLKTLASSSKYQGKYDQFLQIKQR